MIYLHCGWPKTGTSSLQAALARNEDRLAACGVLYPRKWRRRVDGSHNDLADLLRESRNAGPAAFADLKAFSEAHADIHVLFSSESLTASLRDDSSESLLGLLAALREVAPVRCIWTLRRLDEMVRSLYLQLAVAELTSSTPARFMANFPVGPMIDNMRRVEDAVAGDVTYARYDPGGKHNGDLLRAFDLPPALVSAIKREVSAESRLNASLSHKEMVAVLNADVLSSVVGASLTRRMVADVFRSRGGDFRFEHDWPYLLVDRDVRQDLHERALDAARAGGLMSYVRFFGEVEIEDSPFPADAQIDTLGEGDLHRLETRLTQLANVQGGNT